MQYRPPAAKRLDLIVKNHVSAHKLIPNAGNSGGLQRHVRIGRGAVERRRRIYHAMLCVEEDIATAEEESEGF